MIKPFIMTRDINGYNGFGLPVSNAKYQTTLSAGEEQTLTVPPTQSALYPNLLAIFTFEPGNSIWVALNATASAPAGSFVITDSELNPQARICKAGDVWHFITSDAADEIGIIFYAIP